MAKRKVDWRGSFPAIMTPFTVDGGLDEALIRANVRLTLEEVPTASSFAVTTARPIS